MKEKKAMLKTTINFVGMVTIVDTPENVLYPTDQGFISQVNLHRSKRPEDNSRLTSSDINTLKNSNRRISIEKASIESAG